MRFTIYQESRVGGRANNEDRTTYCYSRDALLMVVADGMGGHHYGEIAAQIAVQTLADTFQREAKPQFSVGDLADLGFDAPEPRQTFFEKHKRWIILAGGFLGLILHTAHAARLPARVGAARGRRGLAFGQQHVDQVIG